ncbi:hypothetical protein RCOM_0204720 [Ricinus communis]|uniref:Protein KAKU4 n=1 Tax=Ricinus communis TaxID=3988 RepID=B9SPP2_RICCO|nr:hypothetical protein RCOM_0204720 [Ricinus communis]
MFSNTRTRRALELRSGGKIIRPRRTTAPKTPYERPSPRLLHNSGSQNPNWLSRLILSPTRMIATGAGKVLSVFRNDSSSSSSSSSSGGDFSSESDTDEAEDDDISSQDANKLEKNSRHAIIPQAKEWKSETKRAIEQLLMQETFSREECDRLTYILKSRVVDSPVTRCIDGRLTEIPDTTIGSDPDLPALCSTAITEAKKWLEEKKLGSNSKSELEYGTCTLNTSMLPHVTEGDVGSPVDLAKSYMRARPPWASPSMRNIQSLSPSPVGIQLFKEETPYSFGRNSLPISKLIRDSSATGSWNIQEEIRKVRSKATEDMLRVRPSSVIDWSTLASDIKQSPRSLVAYKAEFVSQVAQDGLQNESSPPDPATSVPEQSQDPRAIKITDSAKGLQDGSEGRATHGQKRQPSEDVKAESQSGSAAADALKDADGEQQRLDSIVGIQGSQAIRLYGGQEREQKSKASEEQQISVDSGHDKMTRNTPVDETCELLSESYIEVPIVNESHIGGTGSQNSSSMHHEGLSQGVSPRSLKRKAGKSNDVTVTEKQQVGKQRYVRKGKGRGK